MTLLDKITEKVLAQIDDTGFTQSGAFNLRHNGIALCHGDSEHIKIKKKQDKPGIDISSMEKQTAKKFIFRLLLTQAE